MYYYIALVYTTTQQFEAVRSFKAGVGIHHYTMTTIQPTAARIVGSSIYEYGSTARAIHDGRRRLIAVRRVGGGGAGSGGGSAAGATLSAGVACMDQAVNHCHSDGSSCSPVFTTATTTRLPPPPPQQPPVCPVEVKHDTHWKM